MTSNQEEEQLQEITFQVPANYVLPPLFQSLDPHSTGITLALGAQAYSIMTKEGQKLRHETLFQELKSQAAMEYEPRLDKLQKQLVGTQDVLEKVKSNLRNEEECRQNTEKRVREEERRNREELLQEKNNRIQSLEQQVKTQLQSVEQSMKDNSRNLQEGFQAFKESMLKTSTGSKRKGDHGEYIFQDIAQKAFGSVSCGEHFNLEAVGTEGHQGDLHMIWKNNKILIEVKNYTRSVDDKEVKKFLRDMEQGRDMSLGILVSLNTGIVGHSKTGSVDIEELRDGRICIYISNFLDQTDPVHFLQSLKPFMETFLLLKDKQPKVGTDMSDADMKIEHFETQRTMMLKLLQHHQENTRKFKNTLQNAKKKQEQIWNELSVDMLKAEHDVKLLLETLLCVHGANETMEDSQMNDEYGLPPYVFHKTDFSMYNDKDKKFIKDLMTYFAFDEDSSCTKKELKDALKPMGYSDEVVSNTCRRLFLEDVWDMGKKIVKCIKKRDM